MESIARLKFFIVSVFLNIFMYFSKSIATSSEHKSNEFGIIDIEDCYQFSDMVVVVSLIYKNNFYWKQVDSSLSE